MRPVGGGGFDRLVKVEVGGEEGVGRSVDKSRRLAAGAHSFLRSKLIIAISSCCPCCYVSCGCFVARGMLFL